jgi:hypothetical protein
VTLDLPPLDTTGPMTLTPLPVMATSCGTEDGFVITIVTLPIGASRVFVLNSRAPPEFASSWSVVPPVDCVPPAAVEPAAGDVVEPAAGDVVEPAAVELVELPPPQPAATSASDASETTRMERGRVIDPRRIRAS